MLSILIPTYKYDVWPLVNALHRQCTTARIDFEILISDDASGEHYNQSAIEQLLHCSYYTQKENIGLSASRNFLIDRAIHPWILLLDADVLPARDNFIAYYCSQIQNHPQPFYSGGICYGESKPAADKILRWKYGREREAISHADRIKNPASFSMCLNILFHRYSCKSVHFNEGIRFYGYEDVEFYKKIAQQGLAVEHLDNPVIHLNADSSQVFLQKTHRALRTLRQAVDQGILAEHDTKISAVYQKINKYRMTFVPLVVGYLFATAIEKNLMGKSPRLFLFDWYKLYHYAQLSKSRRQ